MNRIRYPKGKVLALTPAIALAGLIFNPVLATAEFVPSDQLNPENITSEAIATAHNDLFIPEINPITEPTSADNLEIYSTKASDLLVEGEISPDSEDSKNVPEEDSSSQTPASNESETESSQNIGQRPYLTGDWGGFRSQLKEKGINFELEFTQYLQGLAAGTGENGIQYGGRLDNWINFDTGKLGLWQGGGFNTHLEYRYGELPGSLGGTFFPTNSGMEFPGESPDTLVATSLYFTQKFGDRTSVMLGKINALDLVQNDPFFGGWGTRRFENAVFAAPPSGLVPPVFFGAIANVKLNPVTLSFWVYDPDDRTQEYWPDDLFSNGVTFSLTTAYATKMAGRPTTFSFTGIYSTKTGTDFASVSESFKNGLEPLTKTGTYSLAFQFSHLFHVNKSNPSQGWGVFLKGAISDGNPNYVQNSIIAGIGGTGLFPNRERDSFGLGYFYYDLSDDLQDSLNDIAGPVSVGDEQGIEAYYSYAVTPWFYLTADLQYIQPPRSTTENAFIAGIRAKIQF